MKQEQKELLLKDLCSRLPYGVKVELTHWRDRDKGIIDSRVFPFSLNINNANVLIKETTDVKPYLFPLSSMTGEQSKEYHELIGGMFGTSALINFEVLEDFFHKNHLDYRGLIPMGLANDASGLNIY